MTDLITKLEAAEGGSREIDCQIELTLGCPSGRVRKPEDEEDFQRILRVLLRPSLKHEASEYDEDKHGYCYWPDKCRVEHHFVPDGDRILADENFDIPRYTESIDSALTLMLDGWHIQITGEQGSTGWGVCLTSNNLKEEIGLAPTLALALCIAALRARERALQGKVVE